MVIAHMKCSAKKLLYFVWNQERLQDEAAALDFLCSSKNMFFWMHEGMTLPNHLDSHWMHEGMTLPNHLDSQLST